MLRTATLVLILSTAPACVQESAPSPSRDGVAQETSFPSPAGYVVDTADLLNYSDEASLTNRLSELDASTSLQFAVMTVPSLSGEREDQLALRTFNEWGLGRADVNNGLLILIAEAERKTRISVGLGLEWQISDAVAADALGEMQPFFATGDIASGLHAGVQFLDDRAAAVPWTVAFRTARDAMDAGPDAVGQIGQFAGPIVGGAVVTDAGRVRVSFPSHWTGERRSAESRIVVGRVRTVSPLSVDVLSIKPGPGE